MRDYQTKSNAGGLPDSITTTKFGAGEFNSIANELEHTVESTGQTLAPADGTGEDTYQLVKSMATYGSGGDFYVDSGAANAYVLAKPGSLSEVDDYFDGMRCVFVVSATNTGASTVNVASLGVKSITRIGGIALSAGDLTINEHAVLRYDLANDRFEIEIYSGVKALEIGDGITVGGNTAGDIVTIDDSQDLTNKTYEGGTVGGNAAGDIATTDATQTLSGKSFTQDGTITITDNGATANEYPLNLFAPNSTSSARLRLGVENVVGNTSQFSFFQIGDNDPGNYIQTSVFGGTGALNVYNDGHAALTAGYFTITDTRDSANMTPLMVRNSNLSTGRYSGITFGVNDSNFNNVLIRHYYSSDGSEDNLTTLGLDGYPGALRINGWGNVGIDATPDGSGGARLTVNGDVTADNLVTIGDAQTITGTKTFSRSGPTYINDTGSGVSENPLQILSPNLADTGTAYVYVGKNSGSYNSGVIRYYHNADADSVNNYIGIGPISGATSFNVSNGKAELVSGDLTINGDITADNFGRTIIEIGDWNMDTTASVSVAHGLGFTSIVGVRALVRNDAGTVKTPLACSQGVTTSEFSEASGNISGISLTNVTLYRTTGGLFDSTSYDSTSYNRGWIIIDYIP